MSRQTENLRTQQHAANTQAPEIDFEAEHRPDVAHRASLAGLRREAAVQRKANAGASSASDVAHDAAARGIASPTSALPHADRIQASFGPGHDVSTIQAHVGGSAAADMGARAFASGNHVVFDQPPDLHTAAHEAAHVVQQARGVRLYGGMDEAGDTHEQHADAVADRVVAGESAADLLDEPAASAPSAGAVQRKSLSSATAEEQRRQRDKADAASFQGLESAMVLGAKRLQAAADEIHKLVNIAMSSTNEAGAFPSVEAIRQRIEDASSDLSDLNTRIGAVKSDTPTGMPSTPQELGHALKQLDWACSRFDIEVLRAQQIASQHGDKLGREESIQDITRYMIDIHNKLNIQRENAVVRAVDDRPMVTLAEEAMTDNLTAILEASRSVRMSLATGKDSVVSGEIRKVIRHAGEVAILLTQIGDPKALRKYQKRGQQVLHELEGLEKDIAGKPQLAIQLHTAQFADHMRGIRTKMGRGR